MDKGTDLALLWVITTGKVRGKVGIAGEMLEAKMVSADCGQEGSNSWTDGKFASDKFVPSQNTRLAIR